MVSGRVLAGTETGQRGVRLQTQSSATILTSGLHWQEMAVGARFLTGGRTILTSEIRAFVNLAGMIEPLFTNRDRAQDDALHGDVCPGAYVLTVAEGLVLNATVRDTGLALLSLDSRFRAPTRAGDTIAVEIEVTACRGESNGSRGIVTTRNTVRKTNGVVVLDYDVTRMVAGR